MTTPDAPPALPGTGDDKPVYVDYFSFSKAETFMFPDGVQYIEFQAMNEGAKKRFQKLTSRDLVVQQKTGDARLKIDQGQERHELIRESITGWNMYRGGEPVRFTPTALKDFLELANPELIEDLEKAIRKANPWMLDEMSVEDYDREIQNLQELREVAAERERGEASSGGK